MTSACINSANQDDLKALELWLKEEYDQTASGKGFWNNISITRDAAAQARLFVIRTADGDSPVAFCVCGRGYTSIDILEVHPDFRRQGLGRALACHCIDLARKAGVMEIAILCEPLTSVPFWKTIGFEEVTSYYHCSHDPIEMRIALADE